MGRRREQHCNSSRRWLRAVALLHTSTNRAGTPLAPRPRRGHSCTPHPILFTSATQYTAESSHRHSHTTHDPCPETHGRAHLVVEAAAGGVYEEDFDPGVLGLEQAGHPRNRAPGARPAHKRVHCAPGLPPDLLPCSSAPGLILMRAAAAGVQGPCWCDIKGGSTWCQAAAGQHTHASGQHPTPTGCRPMHLLPAQGASKLAPIAHRACRIALTALHANPSYTPPTPSHPQPHLCPHLS